MRVPVSWLKAHVENSAVSIEIHLRQVAASRGGHARNGKFAQGSSRPARSLRGIDFTVKVRGLIRETCFHRSGADTVAAASARAE